MIKCELYNDHFQNYKQYNIPKAQLVIADIPYNLGNKAYASNPQWYKDGDNKNGESELAGKEFFDTDKDFRIKEFFHFCNHLIKPEPKETNKAGAMIVFCAFQQIDYLIEKAQEYGFKNYYPLVFIKNFSSLKVVSKITCAFFVYFLLVANNIPTLLGAQYSNFLFFKLVST